MNGRCWTAALVLIALSVVSIGCGGTKGGTGGQIEGVNWALESYKDRGAMSGITGDISIDALFEGGMVSGNSGINTYSAPYETSGSSLTIGPAVTTMMAGPEEIMAVEQAYLAALRQASSYTAMEDSLTIFDADGSELLSYMKEEAPTLTGATWSVTGYNNGKQAVVSTIAGSELTAVFSEDGTIAGSGGVNTYSGAYKAEGDTISIGPLATTLMASGDPALMEQETAYLAALQSASRFSIKGDKLDLRREDGALAVTFMLKKSP